MEGTIQQQTSQERRHSSPEKSVLWSRLSVMQKSAASNLANFGYELAFIRNENNQSTAYLTCGTNIASIDMNGDIDSSPSVQLR